MTTNIVRFIDAKTLARRMEQSRKANAAFRRFAIWEEMEIAKYKKKKTLKGVTMGQLEKRGVN